jgi:hypothetical protein
MGWPLGGHEPDPGWSKVVYGYVFSISEAREINNYLSRNNIFAFDSM